MSTHDCDRVFSALKTNDFLWLADPRALASTTVVAIPVEPNGIDASRDFRFVHHTYLVLLQQKPHNAQRFTCIYRTRFRRSSKLLAPRMFRYVQVEYCPPLAVSVDPVIKPASSDARNTTQRATSSGSPRRPTGICGIIRSLSTFSSIARTISVPM